MLLLKHLNKSGGFTLMEMAIVIGIIGIAAGTGMVFLAKYQSSSDVTGEEALIVSILKDARALSLGNRNQSAHGLEILTNTYVLYEGSSYAQRNTAYDISYDRDTNVIITGATEINFAAHNASTNAITIQVASSDKSRSYNININTAGEIDWQ